MEKLIAITMAAIVVATALIGFQAMTDLNDGRVLTVVKQLTTPNMNRAEAKGPATRLK